MASDEFRHASKQEPLNAPSPMGTDDDQIGTPLCYRIEDSLSDVTYFDRGVHREPGATQLARNSLDQLKGRLLLIFQFRSVTWSHLRRSRSTRLQHMQNPNRSMLSPKLRDNGPHHILGVFRIVNAH